MTRIVGIFMDRNKLNLIQPEMERQGYEIRKISLRELIQAGLPKELLPIYRSKRKEGGTIIEASGGREILEDHGAEQIRTV